MFTLIVKATGGKLKNSPRVRSKGNKAPAAGFDTIANFVGAM